MKRFCGKCTVSAYSLHCKNLLKKKDECSGRAHSDKLELRVTVKSEFGY